MPECRRLLLQQSPTAAGKAASKLPLLCCAGTNACSSQVSVAWLSRKCKHAQLPSSSLSVLWAELRGVNRECGSTQHEHARLHLVWSSCPVAEDCKPGAAHNRGRAGGTVATGFHALTRQAMNTLSGSTEWHTSETMWKPALLSIPQLWICANGATVLQDVKTLY